MTDLLFEIPYAIAPHGLTEDNGTHIITTAPSPPANILGDNVIKKRFGYTKGSMINLNYGQKPKLPTKPKSVSDPMIPHPGNPGPNNRLSHNKDTPPVIIPTGDSGPIFKLPPGAYDDQQAARVESLKKAVFAGPGSLAQEPQLYTGPIQQKDRKWGKRPSRVPFDYQFDVFHALATGDFSKHFFSTNQKMWDRIQEIEKTLPKNVKGIGKIDPLGQFMTDLFKKVPNGTPGAFKVSIPGAKHQISYIPRPVSHINGNNGSSTNTDDVKPRGKEKKMIRDLEIMKLEKAPKSRIPRVHNSGSVYVAPPGGELVFDVLSQGLAYNANSYAINPSIAAIFPIASRYATLYNRYRFTHLRAKFVSNIFPTGAPAVNSVAMEGRVLMNFVYDNTDIAPDTEGKFFAIKPCHRFLPHESATAVAQDNLNKIYFLSTEADTYNKDGRLEIPFRLQVATVGLPSASVGQSLGQIILEYGIEFIESRVDTVVTLGNYYALRSNNSGITANIFLGATVVPGSTVTTTIGTNSINLPNVAGKWLGIFTVGGDTTSTTINLPSLVNVLGLSASFDPVFYGNGVAGLSNVIRSSGQGSTTTSGTMMVIVNQPVNSTNTLLLGTTSVTNTASVSFQWIQIPSNIDLTVLGSVQNRIDDLFQQARTLQSSLAEAVMNDKLKSQRISRDDLDRATQDQERSKSEKFELVQSSSSQHTLAPSLPKRGYF